MRKVIDDYGERKKISEIWDHHGSYQWTYFSEEAKQLITFFLSKRLGGRNLDVGAGWYQHYPNSVALDVSKKCLEYNIAKEKVLFDLDDISLGKRLPFKDSSFNSATMISAWQYIKHPKAVVKELERVLKPESEVYIINGQDSGLSECKVSSSNTVEIKKQVEGMGYDSIIERIPSLDGGIDTFKSLCFSMPYKDLFGKRVSRVRNKNGRKEQDKIICENPKLFLEEFASQETARHITSLHKIASYPITEYSKKRTERIEKASIKYNKKTREIPLVFLEHAILPELEMSIEKDEPFLTLIFLKSGKSCSVREDMEAFTEEIDCGQTIGYFGDDTLESLRGNLKSFNRPREEYYFEDERIEHDIDHFVSFISSISINSFAKGLQKDVYSSLRNKVKDLDERIRKKLAWNLHFVNYQHKQRRKIDELIEVKKKIERNGTKIIGQGRLDFMGYSKYFPELILKQ